MKTFKLLTLITFVIFTTWTAQAQHPSSILDLESTTQGVLVPRMTSVQRTAISSPANGLLVFDLTTISFWFYEGSAWVELGGSGGDEISDADADTKVEVERTADDDVIRLSVAGNDKLDIAATTAVLRSGLELGGNSGIGPTQLLLGGSVNSGVNQGSVTGTVKLRIADYNNDDEDVVYPIYSIDENANIDFSIKNRDLVNGTPTIGYFGGNVGIGTGSTDPLTRLSISPSASESKITLWDGGSAVHHYGFGVSSNQLNYHVAGVIDAHVFHSEGKNGDGNEVFRVEGNGKIGIENSNPQTQLHILGGTDLNLSPTSGYFVAGSTSGLNLGLDNNEIQVRNNGNPSTMYLQNEGGALNVGGGAIADGFSLNVNGKIACEELLIDLRGDWPDYVFASDYELKSLDEVQQHINEKGHLPGVPSAKEVEENGIIVGEMNTILMEKIEELTLYILQQEERIRALESNK